MTVEMRQLALLHVRGFDFSKGDSRRQIEFLLTHLPREHWNTTGAELMVDQDSRAVLLEFFKKRHPDKFEQYGEPGSSAEISYQINRALIGVITKNQ